MTAKCADASRTDWPLSPRYATG